MSRRNKVDVVTALRLQLNHYLDESLVGNLIFKLLFVCLRDLIVLTIDASQIAIAKEDVPGSMLADERRLFAEMRRI